MSIETSLSNTMEPAAPRRRRRGVWWWFWRGSLLLLGTLIASHAMWGCVARHRLERTLAALRAKGEPIDERDFINPAVPDAENAALDILAAGKLQDPTDKEFEAFLDLGLELPWDAKEIELSETVLAKCRPAMERLAAAGRKAKVAWPENSGAGPIDRLLPDLRPFRSSAMMLARAAVLAHQKGDDAGAMEHVGQILAMARAMDRQPSLVAHLVAVGMSALACEVAAQMAPDLRIWGTGGTSAPQVRRIIDQLLDDTGPQKGMLTALQHERAVFLTLSRELFGGDWIMTPAGQQQTTGSQKFMLRYLAGPLLYNDADYAMGIYERMITAHTRNNDWPALRQALGNQDWQWEIKKYPIQHLLSSVLMPSFERPLKAYYRGRTDRRMAAIALAIRCYAAEHGGKRPATLEALVPKYLPAVPRDPFAVAPATIQYKADGDRPFLYSVGENGVDDGGNDTPTRAYSSNHEPSRWDRLDAIVYLDRPPRKPRAETDTE